MNTRSDGFYVTLYNTYKEKTSPC